jgi:hypothetical protein
VHYRITHAATVSATVFRSRRVVARRVASARPGTDELVLGLRLPAPDYRLELVARTADGQVAMDRVRLGAGSVHRRPLIDPVRGAVGRTALGSPSLPLEIAANKMIGGIDIAGIGGDPWFPSADAGNGVPATPSSGAVAHPRTGASYFSFGLRGVTYLVYEHRVVGFDAPAGATTADVRVHDPLDAARDAYPGKLRCGVRDADPYCTGQIGRAGYIWFGGDPIHDIAMTPGPFDVGA